MFVAILVYIGVGLVVGVLARFNESETSSLAGMLGTGGAAGLIGGGVANLLFSDGLELDAAGWVGSVVLAIVAVLVVKTSVRARAVEAASEAEPGES
jgi:uncharacterized membrane protein YeaQ/YmgE (transglycosylase-associated protein family)